MCDLSASKGDRIANALRRRGDNHSLAGKAVTFVLDGTLVDLRAVYIRAHQQAASEELEVELEEARVLELMSTGVPIRAHMALLDESAADRLVEVVVAFEDTDEHNPAATPQREALRRLSANAVVSVGDLPSDIASARAAGLAAIGVSWGYGARSALIDAGAECVCDSAEELERELGIRLRHWVT